MNHRGRRDVTQPRGSSGPRSGARPGQRVHQQVSYGWEQPEEKTFCNRIICNEIVLFYLLSTQRIERGELGITWLGDNCSTPNPQSAKIWHDLMLNELDLRVKGGTVQVWKELWAAMDQVHTISNTPTAPGAICVCVCQPLSTCEQDLEIKPLMTVNSTSPTLSPEPKHNTPASSKGLVTIHQIKVQVHKGSSSFSAV